MPLTREERRARRKQRRIRWIKKAKEIWAKYGHLVHDWLARTRAVAPDLNGDKTISNHELARFVSRRAADLIPDTWVVPGLGIRVDSLSAGAVYVVVLVLAFLDSQRPVDDEQLEKGIEALKETPELDADDPDPLDAHP